jgi:hypothetical protein
MKHQGQTMSETISMVSMGVACMRRSFLPGVPAICRSVDCRLGVRKSGEVSRERAEAGRQAAEELRSSAEEARRAAEELRVATEAAREVAEETRQLTQRGHEVLLALQRTLRDNEQFRRHYERIRGRAAGT